MSILQITGDLINAALRLVKELGLPLLAAAIILLFLPPIAAALGLPTPLLIGAIIVLSCISVFAPAPWLVRLAKSAAGWVRDQATYLALSDREKRLLAPFAVMQDHGYWFAAADADLQRLLDRKLLWQQSVIGNWQIMHVRASSARGAAFVARFRRRLRLYFERNHDDAVGKEIDRVMAAAKELSGRRV